MVVVWMVGTEDDCVKYCTVELSTDDVRTAAPGSI